jgi:hypothetical protein
MKALRFCVVGMFAVALLGQAQSRDVDGWGKIHWGMTIADASQAYMIERHEDNDRWSQLIAQPIMIGDITMRVSIAAKHGSEQVSRVRLSTNSGAEDFDTLKAQLIQKYGPPIDGETRTDASNSIRTFLWTFPSTSIRLTLTQGPNGQARIEVEYNATDKTAVDAL